MGKIALLAVAIMLSMAVSGFAYAFWTDHVEVVGEIVTGTFGWEHTLDGDWVGGDHKDIITHDAWLVRARVLELASVRRRRERTRLGFAYAGFVEGACVSVMSHSST
jgi:hypothetical protein